MNSKIKSFTKISGMAFVLISAQSCGDSGSPTIVETPAIQGNTFNKEALNLYALDGAGIKAILDDSFQLAPMTSAEQTAAENVAGIRDECMPGQSNCLTTARQFLHRYFTSFESGIYTVVNQMRVISIMGLACDATTVPALKSGDPLLISSLLLNRPLESSELGVLAAATNGLPGPLVNKATCVLIASTPMAYGQIR